MDARKRIDEIAQRRGLTDQAPVIDTEDDGDGSDPEPGTEGWRQEHEDPFGDDDEVSPLGTVISTTH